LPHSISATWRRYGFIPPPVIPYSRSYKALAALGGAEPMNPSVLHMTYTRNKKSLCPLEALKTQNELQYTGIQHWLLNL